MVKCWAYRQSGRQQMNPAVLRTSTQERREDPQVDQAEGGRRTSSRREPPAAGHNGTGDSGGYGRRAVPMVKGCTLGEGLYPW